jgi:hypothetical protein
LSGFLLPSFAALVQTLLIRIPMLSAVHCGEVWREDFKGLVARAREAETVREETTWVSFHRHSLFRGKERTARRSRGTCRVAGT